MTRDFSTRLSVAGLTLVAMSLYRATPMAGAGDVVLYMAGATTHGHWAVAADATAAGGQRLSTPDNAWAAYDGPLATPVNYFDLGFTADANTPYHVWIRLKAEANSKYNDSVYLQWSDAIDGAGAPVYRIGTTSGLTANLQPCNGCALSDWGWVDGAYWLSQMATIRFTTTGTHTIRVQTREDGVSVDQIVFSPAAYLSTAPGQPINDATILPASPPPPPPTDSSGPFNGTPAAIPGTVQLIDYDTGGEGVAYHDTTVGNSGGAYRQDWVDIEPSTDGGYDVGWIDAGEWLNYSVTVAAAGSYTAQIRVASISGGTMHLGFNGSPNVWSSIAVPSTGGWQAWTTVTVPITLGAGPQLMTVFFDTGGVNVRYVNIVADSGPPPSGPVVVTWNIDAVEPGNGTVARARATMDYIAALTPVPQIVVLQEALQSQWSTYLDELQVRTGLIWRGAFATHCAPGAWTGVSCSVTQDEGVAILTSLPVVDTTTTYLPFPDDWHSARAAVRAGVTVGGRVVQVFGAHMSNTVSARYSMMGALVAFAQGFSSPQLVGGDFNADPDQIDAPGAMGTAFLDAWSVVGVGPGYTCTTPNPTMHLDYWFADISAVARPAWATVVTAPGTFSDHFPMHAAFLLY